MRSYSYFNNKKAREIRACGVSQTPNNAISRKDVRSMKDWFHYADAYIKECDWKDMALIKICLFSLGVFIGT